MKQIRLLVRQCSSLSRMELILCPLVMLLCMITVSGEMSDCEFERQKISQLGGLGLQVSGIRCNGTMGIITWSRDNTAITHVGNPLTISNVVASDEGTYRCHYTDSEEHTQIQIVACLHVLGRAVFNSCQDNVCPEEHINVVSGDQIVFDTAVTYLGAGSMNLNQTVRSLVLKTNAEDPLITCSGSDGCTPQMAGIDYTVGSHPFDVKVVITSASLGDEGIFTATISAIAPDTGRSDGISKTFRVRVQPKPLTTVMSSSATEGLPQPTPTSALTTVTVESAGLPRPTLTSALTTVTVESAEGLPQPTPTSALTSVTVESADHSPSTEGLPQPTSTSAFKSVVHLLPSAAIVALAVGAAVILVTPTVVCFIGLLIWLQRRRQSCKVCGVPESPFQCSRQDPEGLAASGEKQSSQGDAPDDFHSSTESLNPPDVDEGLDRRFGSDSSDDSSIQNSHIANV